MLSNHELLPLAIVVLVALCCGILLTRLKQPAVVGYIFAGFVLGPSGFELVENEASIGLLAELGMLLLLYVIGMELSSARFPAHLEDRRGDGGSADPRRIVHGLGDRRSA